MKHLQPNDLIQRLIRISILGPLLIGIGIVGLSFTTIVRNPYTILYPLALIGAAGIFYIFRPQNEIKEIKLRKTYSRAILVSISVLLLALAVLYYYAGFQRSNAVFYLTFALYIFTALYVLGNPDPAFGLSVILLAGITNRLTGYYNSALYSGVDIYSHSRWTQAIAQEGSLAVFSTNKYFYAPFYHIFAAVGELIYSVPTRDAIALTSLLAVSILPVLVAYSITSTFWNSQVGLIAGWLYVTSDYAINWGIHVIPTSLGVAFFALLMGSLITYTGLKEKRQYGLVIALVLALMFTHQVSLFIGIVAMGVLALSIIVYRMRLPAMALNLGLIAGMAMFVDFIVTKYGGPSGEASFFDVVLSNLLVALLSIGAFSRTEIVFPNDPTLSPGGAAALTLPQIAGSTLLLFLAVFGALYWLSMRRTNRVFFTGIMLSTVITALLVITLAGPVIGLRNLLPSRWWAFTYLLLAIFAAPGLQSIIQSIRTKWNIRSGAVSGIVILLVFTAPYAVLMGGNYAGAPDQPLHDEAPGAETMKISESEKLLLEHSVAYKGDIDFVSDRRFSEIFSRYYSTPSGVLHISYNDPDTLNSPSIVVNREYIHSNHAQYYIEYNDQRVTVHGAFPLESISAGDKEILYDSGDDELIHYHTTDQPSI